MKTCASCGYKCEDNEPDCPNCGSSLFLYKCPNCGTEFEEDFCPICGYVVEVTPKEKEQGFITPEKKTLFDGNKGNMYADAAMSFSFIGLVTCLAVPFSVVGVVLAILAMRKGCDNNKPVWAITLAALSVITALLFFELYKPMFTWAN